MKHINAYQGKKTHHDYEKKKTRREKPC